MRAVVTGTAGFIGAALTRALLRKGDEVIGIDCFLDSYPREVKKDRLVDLLPQPRFRFVEADLLNLSLNQLLNGVDCVFHLAAQAGVRRSWGGQFGVYTQCNILATQKLLEAAKETPSLSRFIYASSSSVYGDTATLPTPEDSPLCPLSPYAVSKLAGEHLCHLYQKSYGVPTVVLRYFTVYGPQPRPDQAVCLFTRALLSDQEIQIFGDGEQLRGMTYVDDVVEANLLAAETSCVGEIFNIGGGTSITVNELITHLEHLTGKTGKVRRVDPARGDARHTLADIRMASRLLAWMPQMATEAGLARTVASIRDFYFPAGMA